MILVDTSTWILALRNGAGPEAGHLRVLLDQGDVALAAPVKLELLSGASTRDRPKLRRTLSALPILTPSEASWATAEEWIESGARKGQRFGIMDLLIGVLASEAAAAIWSLDADFSRMERLGWISLHRAPA